MKTYTCGKCDKPYASSQSLWNHKQRCKGTGTKRRYDEKDILYESNDRKLKKADNNMIQSTLDDRNSMIQPIQSTLEEEEEEEERVERSAVLSEEIDDLIDKFIDENFPGLELEEEIDQLKDDIWHEICEHTEFEGGLINYTKPSWISRREHAKLSSMSLKPEENEDENEEDISEEELKNRLYRSGSNIKVFELDLQDKSIQTMDLLEYVKVLKIPKFRGVELPKEINPVECGIVNLNTPEEPHWICY